MATSVKFPTGNATTATIAGTVSAFTNALTGLNADDGVDARIATATKNTNATITTASAFGFDADIPVGAVIDQVDIEVQTQNVTTSQGTQFVAVVVGGTVGVEQSNAGSTTLTTRTFTNMTKSGGVALSRADLLNGTFAVRVRALQPNNTTSTTYGWDYVKVTVTYHLPVTATDSKGTNNGTYTGGFTTGQAGPFTSPATYSTTILAETGLVSFWKLDEGGVGTAAKFDGTTGYVDVPNNTSLNMTDGPLSIEAIVKLNAIGAFQNIIGRGNGGYAYRINSSNNLEFLSMNTAGIVSSSTTITNDGNFHHVVATKNGATTLLYIDGVDRTGTVTNATLTNPAQNLGIGQQNASNNTEWFNGWICCAAVYSVVLTGTQVTDHFSAITATGAAAVIPDLAMALRVT